MQVAQDFSPAQSDAYKALVDAHVTQVKPWEPND